MVVPPNSTAMTSKDALRSQMRRVRRDFVASLAPNERSALHRALAAQVRAHLPSAGVIGSYYPYGSEIDPAQVDTEASAVGLSLSYPWFATRGSEMLFRARGAMVPGPFGFPQPVPDLPLAFPGYLFVPLVAVDLAGYRIGQGAGHYDRMLVDRTIKTIGLAYDVQVVDRIVPDPWDVPLQAIATPTRWIEIGG